MLTPVSKDITFKKQVTQQRSGGPAGHSRPNFLRQVEAERRARNEVEAV